MARTSGSAESSPTISGYPAGANPLIAALRANSPAPARLATGPTTLNFPWMQNTAPGAPPTPTPTPPPANPVPPPARDDPTPTPTPTPDPTRPPQPGDPLPDDEEWQYIDFGNGFGGQWLRVPKSNRTPATPTPPPANPVPPPADPVPPPGGDDPWPTPTPTPAPTPAPADPFMPPEDEGRPVYPPPYTPPPVDEAPAYEDPGYDFEYVDFGDGFGGQYVQVPRKNYTQPAPIAPPPYTPPAPPNYDDYEYYDDGNLL